MTKNDGIPRHIQLYLFTHLDIYVDYKPVAVDYSRIVDLCQWNVGTGCAFVVDPVKVPILLTSLRNKRTDAERTRTTTATQGTHGIIAKDQQHIGTIAPAFAANIPF